MSAVQAGDYPVVYEVAGEQMCERMPNLAAAQRRAGRLCDLLPDPIAIVQVVETRKRG